MSPPSSAGSGPTQHGEPGSVPVARSDEEESVAGTGTLGKAIAVLDLVAGADQPLRFGDLLRIAGQPRGSLHRQLRHLVAEGLLDVAPDGSYSPGLRLLAFASKAWSRNSVRQIAEPHLHRLQEMTGETIHFGVLRGVDVVYLDKLESRQAVRMHSQVGNNAPVYCTGVGKAALASLDPAARADLIGRLVFRSFTPETLIDAAGLNAEIGETVRRGYALDWEEHQPGIRCVAASIRVDTQGFVGGVSVTAPAFRADRAQLQAWSVPLRTAAAAISRDVECGLGPRR